MAECRPSYSSAGFLLLLVGCFHAGSASLFPEKAKQLEFSDPLMPNEEQSVRDCPFTIYQYGGYALASSIFAERFVDKTFSHTARVRLGEVYCVGIIVDENHVLTNSECVDEIDLPEVKLTNETLPVFEVAETFSNSEFNVTLLRLNSSIEFNSLAVPACFWNAPYEKGFEKLQRLFVDENGNMSVESTKCTFQNRKDCLEAIGNTGDILQTRTIAKWRMHPFVLSFGLDESGAPVPVSQYIDWISKMTESNISSSECVARHETLRDYEDSMVSKSDNYQTVQYSKSRFSYTELNMYKVRIIPSDTEKTSKRHCYGSLIGPKFVISSASCLKQHEGQTYEVEMGQQYTYQKDAGYRAQVPALKVHYHPEYDVVTSANDVALVELVAPIHNFSKNFLPACIWTHEKLPVDLFQINGYAPFDNNDDLATRTQQMYVTAGVYDDCVDKLESNQFCAGFPTALPPETCHNSIGSAMSRSLYAFERFYEYIFAINSRGENCGFNWPTIFTKISPYIQWIDSIIFAPKVRYEDKTSYYGDRCSRDDGTEGTCVYLKQCPKLDKEAQQGNSIVAAPSCSYGMEGELVVCCSDENFLREESQRPQLTAAHEELENCANLYHEFRRNKSPYKVDNFPTYPYLVRIDDGENRTCNGTIVSKQFILTTAGCYQQLGHDNVTIVAGNTTHQRLAVQDTFIHPEYRNDSAEYNLVLLRLEKPLSIDNETIPACLWNNHSHTPLRLEEVYSNPNPTHQYYYPLFSKECERKHRTSVKAHQLCIEQDLMFYQDRRSLKLDAGNGLVSHFAQGVHEYKVTYLVGLYGKVGHSFEDNSDSDYVTTSTYSVYQRISEYYHWIRNVILVAMQGV
ncbi:hypothetical protein AND_004797 [Anopheles darlingi]|uniref:Uncharacterized protein n=1 Tax=Anopheles darlingi TaxID=43151 RepID=W5JKP9_ANODA|nr:hypothetical protein AND_004797 [Anopheles darlingi]